MEGIRGGNIKHGFISGLASAAGGSAIGKYGSGLSVAGKVAANAVLTGTVTELGGGKFANGAITGAYEMMFNTLLHQQKAKKAASSEGETWYYGVQSSGVFDTGHAFAYNPNTGIIYEINHHVGIG